MLMSHSPCSSITCAGSQGQGQRSGPGPAVRARARGGQWSGLGLGFKRPLVRHALQPTIVLPLRRAKDEAASVEVQVARPGGA